MSGGMRPSSLPSAVALSMCDYQQEGEAECFPNTLSCILSSRSGLVLGGAATCFAQSDAPIIIQDRPQEVGPETQDRVIQERTIQRERMGDRTIVKERVVERRREGEVYVGGFGGFTWGHNFDNAEGTGTLKGAPIGSLDLANSGVYGAKIGYFHPGTVELAWPGSRRVQFDSSYEEGAGLPGSHLRVTTLAFNVIARTKLGCKTRDHEDQIQTSGRPAWLLMVVLRRKCAVPLPALCRSRTGYFFRRDLEPIRTEQ